MQRSLNVTERQSVRLEVAGAWPAVAFIQGDGVIGSTIVSKTIGLGSSPSHLVLMERRKDMDNEVLEFIRRRFSNDCHWLDGNCYYFAMILRERFDGVIMYDVIRGHFVTQIDGFLYDWRGIVDESDGKFIEWYRFNEYDSLQLERVVEDCIL